MDFDLTEEQQMLQETLRKFVEKECTKERVRELDEKDEFPEDMLKKLLALGVGGLTIPEAYGGMGRDLVGACIVLEETSRRYPALGWAYVMSAFYGGENIGQHGTEKQKQFFLPKLANGEILFAYAVTEPDAGSDAAAASTLAVKREDGYVISGTKTMITGANRAEYLLVLTRTSREGKKHQGLTMFIVDSKTEGVKIRDMEKLGYKGSGCCEVVFDEVVVSEGDILGGPDGLNRGWRQLLATLDVEHLELAACAVGLAQGAFEEAMQYAKDREQFGQPISRFQAINHKLAEMATRIHQARLTLHHTVWLAEAGKPFSLESAMTKYVATETAKFVALEGLQIHGGYGYMLEYDAQRYVRDSLILTIGGGTSEIQKNIIAGLMGLLK